MNILIFSDLHAHNYQDFSHYDGGSNSRLDAAMATVLMIADCATEVKAKHILFGGDVFHLKNFVDSQVLRYTFEMFKHLASVAPVHICAGNHDYKSWDKDPVLVEMASGLLGDISMTDRADLGEGWTLFTFNYRRNIDELTAVLEHWNPVPKSIGLFHQDTIGSKYGGIEVMKGLSPDLLAQKFDLSVIGHYHTPHIYNPKVISIGAPLAHNFGDVESAHGWWVFDTASRALQFIQNSSAPRFIDLDVDEKLAKEIEAKGLMALPGSPGEDYYRVKLYTHDIPDAIKQLRWKRISVAGGADGKSRTSIKFSDDVETLVRKYVEQRAPEGLDKERLVEIGRRLL